MSNTTKQSRSARDLKIVDAIEAHFTGATKLTLCGQAFSAKGLQSQFQSTVDAAKATESARIAWNQAMLAERKVVAQTTPIRKALRSYLLGIHEPTSAIVADFGFTPKTSTLTVAEKSAAIEKRTATRAANGTTKKKQRQDAAGTEPTTDSGAGAQAPTPSGAASKPAPTA